MRLLLYVGLTLCVLGSAKEWEETPSYDISKEQGMMMQLGDGMEDPVAPDTLSAMLKAIEAGTFNNNVTHKHDFLSLRLLCLTLPKLFCSFLRQSYQAQRQMR